VNRRALYKNSTHPLNRRLRHHWRLSKLTALAFWGKGEHAAAVPFFQRAITLDPNFSMAYAVLGTVYSVLGETSFAI
jgi:Tfp pilus assembly protein PilF